MEENFEERMLSTEEVAEILKVKVGTLAQRRCNGFPPRYVKYGNRILYKYSDIVKFVNESTVEPVNKMSTISGN